MIYRQHRSDMKLHKQIQSDMKTTTARITEFLDQMEKEKEHETTNNQAGSKVSVAGHQERAQVRAR